MNTQCTRLSIFVEYLLHLYFQIVALGGELERVAGISSTDLIHLKKDSRRDLELTTERNENSIRDIKNAFQLYKTNIGSDMDRINERMTSMVEKATITWTQMLVSKFICSF